MPDKKKTLSIVDIWDKTEAIIDETILNNEKMLLESIYKLEKNVISMASKAISAIDPKKSTIKELKMALSFHKNLIIEFDQVYEDSVRKTIKDYDKVEKTVVKEFGILGIPIVFSSFDKDAFKAMKSAAIDSFKNLSDDAISKLSQTMYDSVLTGGAFGDLVKDFSTVLSKEGTLARYSKQKAHDSLMNYYTRINLKKAADAKLTSFIWYGNIIGSSRPFCIVRAGRIFTLKQIQKWDSWKWKGKKPGSTLINRGGYNCRHSLHPVKKEWIDEEKIEVQNWYEEQNDMPDKLKAEVKAEEKRMKGEFMEAKKK